MRRVNAKVKGSDSTSLDKQLSTETKQKETAESHVEVGWRNWYWAVGIVLVLILCLWWLWKLLQNSVV